MNATDSSGPSVTEALSAHWAKAGYHDLPDPVVAGIKDHILDTLAVACYGAQTPEAAQVISALSEGCGGSSGSTVWGTDQRLPPAHAALANGTSAHARDFDDGGGAGHAGSTVIPAALATAEHCGATGREFLTAVVAGYDIGYRALAALGGFATHTDRGWHSSGTMGSLGAAGAAAKVVALDAEQYRHALGIAGSFTGGIWAFKADGALTKRLHPGKAGETGVDAALLAKAGITGPRWLFEAEWGGMFATYNGGQGFPERALDGLGADFNVATSYLKPYACCRGSHSTIDALMELMATTGITAHDVAAVRVTAGETAVHMLSVDPVQTLFDAQFSLPYAVAVALCGGRLGLDDFEPLRMGEPLVRDTIAKVCMRADSTIELEDGPLLDITLTDGRLLRVAAGNPTTAKGSAQRPMTHAEVVDKATHLLSRFGNDVAGSLVSAVEQIDDASDVQQLVDALRTTKSMGNNQQ